MLQKVGLNDGNAIPQVGLGTWKITDKAVFDTAFNAAIKSGYRHFDTAQIYNNEQLLGEAWVKSGLDRKDVFITTKISVANFGHKKTLKSFKTSLEKLQTDYVDLLLLHFPVTVLRKKSWQALEQIKAAGQAKSIGVSNYTVRHLEEMKDNAKEMPAVNQVELHLFLQQPELVGYCQKNNIAVEAYSPLAHAKDLDNRVISEIAKKHSKSYAQIMLRWCLEQGFIVLPKSATPSRIRDNIDITDFKLDKADLKKLKALDSNLRTCWSPVHVP